MDYADPRQHDALAQLNVLIGEWVEQVNLPDVPAGRMTFEWALDGNFLVQRSLIPEPAFPDSLAIIAVASGGTSYTQHYFDSRGVVRTYVMTLDDRTWTLLRDRADFSPLNFEQRFTGTFSADGDTINAAWEQRDASQQGWRTDFTLTYTRILATDRTAVGQEKRARP